MKLKIYSIYDSVAQAFQKPFYMHNDGEALRMFQQAVNDPHENNVINKHPEQFTLFHVGEWEDKNATIDTATPKAIGLGIEYVEPSPQTELQEIKTLLQKLTEEKTPTLEAVK